MLASTGVRSSAFVLSAAVAGCASGMTSPPDGHGAASDARTADARPDASPPVDASATSDAAVGVPDAALAAYRHTIVVDGVDDFAAGEALATTSDPGYTARLTWDDTNLYVGYRGPDLSPTAPDAGSKWLFVYIDTDPGAGTGTGQSLTYNTQRATFPTGFGAELYARWKCSGAFASIEAWQGTGWATSATALVTGQAADFVELAIPRSLFAGAPVVGVTAWMINEKPGVESSYAGLYAGNFADGYAANLVLTRYLAADFAGTAPPADESYMKP